MQTVTLRVDPGAARIPVPDRLFGAFVEHMGRCVYEGIYEPGHPTADADGFRDDVRQLVRELGATAVRYPGGNFVSGYRWEDGVGPVEERPVRLDAAWHSVESNRVGLHEMAAWCDSTGLELIEAINLGTRGVQEAADLLEYANHPSGTALSDRRRANGAAAPLGIRTWCLGNEMDGPWQIGHKTADEYGRLAAETARLMRFIDPTVELVAAGSSNIDMPTFGAWERTVLRHTAGLVDHLSVHAYYEEVDGDADSFLASAAGLDHYLETVAAIIDEIAQEITDDASLPAETAAERSAAVRRVGISVDEWNVWYQRRWNEIDKPRVLTGDWPESPRLIEDEYSVTDAVVVGSLLVSLLRHADRVSMANLAQLVNVIAPIRSEPGGPAWKQTTFHPFQLTSALALGGEVLEITLGSPTHATAVHGEVPTVDAVAVRQADGRITVFAVNRSLETASDLRLALDGVTASAAVADAVTLTVPEGGSRHDSNTAEHPDRVVPVPLVVDADDDGFRVALPALSWSAITVTPHTVAPRAITPDAERGSGA